MASPSVQDSVNKMPPSAYLKIVGYVSKVVVMLMPLGLLAFVEL